jgi:hypothetical protein
MENKFFCPLYGGEISQYDCDELCCGVNFDYIPNDGLPALLPINIVREKKQICVDCQKEKNE